MVRYQYRQKEQGVLELRVMTRPGFGQDDVERLTNAFHRKVGDELEVLIRPIDDIPLTKRGKLRRLIQEIPPDNVKNESECDKSSKT